MDLPISEEKYFTIANKHFSEKNKFEKLKQYKICLYFYDKFFQ